MWPKRGADADYLKIFNGDKGIFHIESVVPDLMNESGGISDESVRTLRRSIGAASLGASCYDTLRQRDR